MSFCVAVLQMLFLSYRTTHEWTKIDLTAFPQAAPPPFQKLLYLASCTRSKDDHRFAAFNCAFAGTTKINRVMLFTQKQKTPLSFFSNIYLIVSFCVPLSGIPFPLNKQLRRPLRRHVVSAHPFQVVPDSKETFAVRNDLVAEVNASEWMALPNSSLQLVYVEMFKIYVKCCFPLTLFVLM